MMLLSLNCVPPKAHVFTYCIVFLCVVLFFPSILKQVNGFSLNDHKEVKVYRIPFQICHISVSPLLK